MATTTTIDTDERDRLLAETLAEMQANEPDDTVIPGLIDSKVDEAMAMWFISYSTS